MPVRKPDCPVMNEARPAVQLGEQHAFICDAVDVGCLEAHQAARVGAYVGLSDVVAPDDDDVGFLLLLGTSRRTNHCRGEYRGEQTGQKFSEDRATHDVSLPY
jgi:hypothetical protein